MDELFKDLPQNMVASERQVFTLPERLPSSAALGLAIRPERTGVLFDRIPSQIIQEFQGYGGEVIRGYSAGL